jgi:hypothetical protein
MRARLQTHHLAAGLLTASALLSFSCAQLIGADFDKPFATGGDGGGGAVGGGGAAGAMASGSAAVTGTGGMGGGGGAGGTGGSGPVASCPDQAEESSGFCTIHVYVQRVDQEPMSTIYTTNDAILTFASSPPLGYEKAPTSTFTLPRASSSSDSTALYSCVEEDKTHTLARNSPCEVSTFLGYLFEGAPSSVPTGYKLVPLASFSTGPIVGGSTHDHDRALILQEDTTEFCDLMMMYGGCGNSPYFALVK